MEAKIKQQTAIYAICCLIFCIKKVAANRKINCLMLNFHRRRALPYLVFLVLFGQAYAADLTTFHTRPAFVEDIDTIYNLICDLAIFEGKDITKLNCWVCFVLICLFRTPRNSFLICGRSFCTT